MLFALVARGFFSRGWKALWFDGRCLMRARDSLCRAAPFSRERWTLFFRRAISFRPERRDWQTQPTALALKHKTIVVA
jgi:hypothetical protein